MQLMIFLTLKTSNLASIVNVYQCLLHSSCVIVVWFPIGFLLKSQKLVADLLDLSPQLFAQTCLRNAYDFSVTFLKPGRSKIEFGHYLVNFQVLNSSGFMHLLSEYALVVFVETFCCIQFWQWRHSIWCEKTRIMGWINVEKVWWYVWSFWCSSPLWLTEWPADRPTELL